MRRALLIAATLAATLAAEGARAEDPKTTTDIRCVIVAGSLAQSTDPDLQKIGTVSLIYFWGRLEGRDATGNIDARIVEEASKMTADDIKTQAQTCGAMVTAAGQALQDLGAAVQQRIGGAAPASPAK